MSHEPPTSLLDLPNEVLHRILIHVDDLYEYLKLASCCRLLQRLVKQIVVVCGDDDLPSGNFRSIASNEYVQLALNDVYMTLSAHERNIALALQKYWFVIFEFSDGGEYFEHDDDPTSDDYLMMIAKALRHHEKTIIEVFLNEKAAKRTFTKSINHLRLDLYRESFDDDVIDINDIINDANENDDDNDDDEDNSDVEGENEDDDEGEDEEFDDDDEFNDDNEHDRTDESRDTDTREYIDAIGQVSLTIFLNKSDLGLECNEDLVRYGGRCYEFWNIKELQRFYFHNIILRGVSNPTNEFMLRSNSLEVVHGLMSSSMITPRLPPLLRCLELSHLPNLKRIEGIAIESGISFKMFIKFERLEVLHLHSAFTGNLELQMSMNSLEDNDNLGPLVLNSLKELEIVGNSISLHNTFFPNLEKLTLQVHGSLERAFSESLFWERVSFTPKSLKKLSLEISCIPTGLKYLLKTFPLDILKNLTEVELISNYQSFLDCVEIIGQMANLEKLTLSHNDLLQGRSTADLADSNPNLPLEGTEIEPTMRAFTRLSQDLPRLKYLSLLNFDRLNDWILDEPFFSELETLKLTIKVRPSREQTFEFSSSQFPKLKDLTVDYFNAYAHLQKCNIRLILDVKGLNVVYTRHVPDVEYRQDPEKVWVYVVG